MKQRINLFAAGCALLIIISLFVLPYTAWNEKILDDDWVYNNGFDFIYSWDWAYNDDGYRMLPETFTNIEILNWVHIYDNALLHLAAIPVLGVILLFSSLFIRPRTSMGMGIIATVFVVFTLLQINAGGSICTTSLGGFAVIPLFVLFCILEGLRNHLPGYKKQKESAAPRTRQQPMYAAQAGYGATHYYNGSRQPVRPAANGQPRPAQQGYGYPAQQPRPNYGAPQGYGYQQQQPQQPQQEYVPQEAPVENAPVQE